MDLEQKKTLVLTRNTWPIEVNRHGTSQTDIDKLRQTFQKEGREFVEELYREFLNREPDLEGLEVHTSLLTSIYQKFNYGSNIVVGRGPRPSQFLCDA